jgi:allophanate hydrolase
VSALDPSRRLDIASLRRAYRDGETTPTKVVDSVVAAIAAERTEGIWIHRRDPGDLAGEARSLERRYSPDARPPLYGVPFGIKDSVDVAGVPTTVACPDFAYVAERTAPVVERLRAAGALYVGKTNLDQFATGLVGVRSPYGVPTNPFDPRYVTGGSSSGSAAAVARGQVTFAIATDTAGSGRVPAAFNNIVGLKPSRGLLSTSGLVPACRSIDCMTVLALTCEDARDVAEVGTAFDPDDPFSRPEAARFAWRAGAPGQELVVGIPRDEDLVFGDPEARRSFERARSALEGMGLALERVDLGPFYEAGQLLYRGPWIAERLAGLEAFIAAHPTSLLPVIRSVLADGERYRATDAFRALQRLAELKRTIEPLWRRLEALVVPTTALHPRIDQVLADPIEQNALLGRYTTFGNLLDLSGVAVPSWFRDDGLPAGITLLGPWGRDASLLTLAGAFHRKTAVPLGATGWPQPPAERAAVPAAPAGFLAMAVVGAHLSGQPLNHQLTERGARLLRTAHTAPRYRLYALPGTQPPKPGLVRVASEAGAKVELEVWALPTESVGSFIAGVASPLAIGTIELDDGARVHGFLCEGHAAAGAEDISALGGWRAYLRRAGV